MKKYNLSKPEKYLKDGVEKTYWTNVGTMTEFEKQDGTISRFIEIPAIGLKASVFAVEPKEPTTYTAPKPVQTVTSESSIQYPQENVNPEDIPF